MSSGQSLKTVNHSLKCPASNYINSLIANTTFTEDTLKAMTPNILIIPYNECSKLIDLPRSLDLSTIKHMGN